MTAKTLGKILAKARKDAGLTQATVSEKASITIVYLSYLENGKYEPSFSLLVRLVKIYGVTLGELFGS